MSVENGQALVLLEILLMTIWLGMLDVSIDIDN